MIIKGRQTGECKHFQTDVYKQSDDVFRKAD